MGPASLSGFSTDVDADLLLFDGCNGGMQVFCCVAGVEMRLHGYPRAAP